MIESEDRSSDVNRLIDQLKRFHRRHGDQRYRRLVSALIAATSWTDLKGWGKVTIPAKDHVVGSHITTETIEPTSM